MMKPQMNDGNGTKRNNATVLPMTWRKKGKEKNNNNTKTIDRYLFIS